MKKAAALIKAGVVMLATGQATAQISQAGRTFTTKAAASGAAEMVLGRLATEKAGSGQVRQFGQQMVTDHCQAKELKAIAKQKNLQECAQALGYLAEQVPDYESNQRGGKRLLLDEIRQLIRLHRS
jgi:predicted outer membrane protein